MPNEAVPDLSTTDVGNAQRFVRQHGGKLRYSFQLSSWLVFDGKRWKRDDQNYVIELAKDTARSIYKEAFECADNSRRQLLATHARNTESNGGLNAMIKLAKTDAKIVVETQRLDSHPMLLNVANGTIDLSDGKRRPHSPTDLLTKLVPIEHDPDAECPRWTEFVREITAGDESLQRYLAQVAGYCLTGSTKEQAFFLMYGGGSNGKSVFLNVLRKLLGEYGSTTDFDTFSQRRKGTIRDDLAKLKGYRLALCSEIEAGERLAEGIVKQVTGGDEISVRELYGKPFEYQPQYKILLATNHLPNVKGTGNGIWRRAQVVPFDVTFNEDQQDRDLMDKLVAELPGILNWALEGCSSWQIWGRLDVPDCVRRANREYREEMDSVHSFVNDQCVREAGAKIRSRDLFGEYAAWCERGGLVSVNLKVFGTRLTEGGVGSHKNGQGNTERTGVRLKTAAEKELGARPIVPDELPERMPALPQANVAMAEEAEYDPFFHEE